MSFQKSDNLKEYVCKTCSIFFDTHELKKGMCPNCNTDENIFYNDLNCEEE